MEGNSFPNIIMLSMPKGNGEGIYEKPSMPLFDARAFDSPGDPVIGEVMGELTGKVLGK